MAKRRAQVKQSISDDPEAVLAAVKAISASGLFDDDDRSLQLLRYLVDEQLAGREKLINAQNIGVEVLGHEPKFNPTSDSEVRLAILQLRHGLEQYYDRRGQYDPVKIALKPATLQLDFSEQKIATPIQPELVANASNRRLPSRRQLIIALVAILALSAAATAAIFLVGLWSNRSSACTAARPFVAVSFTNTAGFDQDKVKEWELTLRRYMDYYPRITQEPDNVASCPGTPTYQLEITNPADPVAPVLASLSTMDGKFVWSKPYIKIDFAGGDGEIVGLAKIAYEIGFGQGVVPLDATNRPWQNQQAFNQYKCINQAHVYFASTAQDKYKGAVSCLKELITKARASGDAYGLYAALLYDPIVMDRARTTEQLNNAIKQAITIGKSKEPINSELLTIEMRIARNDDSNPARSFGTTNAVTGIVERYFRMEPHLLNQVAISNAAQGSFDEALKYSARAEAIMGDASSSFIPRTIANIGLGRWAETKADIQKLSGWKTSRGQLMLLAIAYENGEREYVTFALEQLKELGFESRQQILAEIAGMPFSKRFKVEMIDSISALFDQMPSGGIIANQQAAASAGH